METASAKNLFIAPLSGSRWRRSFAPRRQRPWILAFHEDARAKRCEDGRWVQSRQQSHRLGLCWGEYKSPCRSWLTETSNPAPPQRHWLCHVALTATFPGAPPAPRALGGLAPTQGRPGRVSKVRRDSPKLTYRSAMYHPTQMPLVYLAQSQVGLRQPAGENRSCRKTRSPCECPPCRAPGSANR